MRVTYSVGASVPGGGIGNVASHQLHALVSTHNLHKAYLTENKTDFLPLEKVRQFPYLGRIPYYFLKDNLFDLLVASQITQTDIFHGWNNFSLLSLRRVKKWRARVIIERASSHILTQNKLLIEEMAKFGLKEAPINKFTIKKSIQEYLEADVVLVPSQFAFDSFLENGFPKQKLRLLPFGVDISKFEPVNKDDGIFRAIFVGQVGIRKGLPYLLQAWQELNFSQSELLIIGPIFPDFARLIKNYNLKNVKMINYTNNLSDYYKMSDVFVFPSIEEGSALVIYEAMASGLPVICTPNSGSLVTDGQEGFLVPAGHSESLKERLIQLYNNRDQAQNMGQKARQKIEGYSWDQYEKKLLKIYEDIYHE